MKKRVINLMAGWLLIMGLMSCNKNDHTPVEVPKRDFKIAMNDDYYPANKTDSAYVLWPTGSGFDSIRLQVQGNTLTAPLDSFPPGVQTFSLSLYSSVKIGQRYIRWDKELQGDFKGSAGDVVVAAPTNIDDTIWLPRVILNDHSGLIALSGIRPADAHFSFCRLDPSWVTFTVDRSYWNVRGGIQRLASDIWQGERVLDAAGNYSNNNFFTHFPAQLGNHEWNHIELIMLFTNSDPNMGTRILDFFQDFN